MTGDTEGPAQSARPGGDPEDGPGGPPGGVLSVCVFCGARDGQDPRIHAEAEALGAGVAAMGARLVYGAGDLGLMGRVAAAARAAGGRTMGVIPRGMWEREIARRPPPEDVVVESLHHRKSVMLANAQAVVILPGGIGTLDEVIETLTWRQLGLHDKPIIAVDVDGYWAPLRALFAAMRRSGFLHGDLSGLIAYEPDAAAALRRLRDIAADPPGV